MAKNRKKATSVSRRRIRCCKQQPEFYRSIEGKDIPKGVTDVIVTDGFTGNVILKLSEGLVSFILSYIKATVTSAG